MMHCTTLALVLPLVLAGTGAPALAQAAPAAGAKHPVVGTQRSRSKPARPPVAPPPAADAERAARLDANRRKFFEDQARGAEATSKPVLGFGGYDADTMSGKLSPGFKF